MNNIIQKNALARIALSVIVLLTLLYPLTKPSNYMISTLVTCFVFSALGVCWNLIGGYGAQISWCHAAFVAIGAYTGMICYNSFGLSPLLSMPIGMLIAFVISTIIGNMTFRLRGTYFSIATIAFAEIVRVLLIYFEPITGGSLGAYVTYSGQNPFNLIFSNDTPFYYIMLAALTIIVFITSRFEKSKIGYSLRAIKGDEDAAFSLGIKTFRVKLNAFQLSAVMTSAIGTLYAFFLTFIEPKGISGLDLSVKIGVVAIVGGVGTLWGPVLGAFIIIPLIELAGTMLGQSGATQLLYGLALVLVVMFKPDGVISLFNRKAKQIPAGMLADEEGSE